MKTSNQFLLAVLAALIIAPQISTAQSPQQLKNWLKRFPDADANGDGRLTIQEAAAYRQKRMRKQGKRGGGPPREFRVDPGWEADRFPDHAACYLPAKEIAQVYASTTDGKRKAITSYPPPPDGSLRIVGTGHSFMAPGYKTFPLITRAAGLQQPPPLTHTGGGMTGSARYKWEQENGIFQFDRDPTPKLLASIANAKWDAMMWGPYYNDRPEYYACWIDFCLKYNPEMKFYMSDAWPQLGQLEKPVTSETELTPELFARLGKQKNESTTKLIDELKKQYPDKVFVMPTSDAMVLAVQYYHRGELPGVQGVHKAIGKKERSLWRDPLGHLGPGFGQLEGYVFYATIYGRSPEQISEDIRFEKDVRFEKTEGYPSAQLDGIFRKIAWQAVVNNPLSGVTDTNRNGVADGRE